MLMIIITRASQGLFYKTLRVELLKDYCYKN